VRIELATLGHRPTRYQLPYRRHGVNNKPAPGSNACEATCETGRTKSRSQPANRPGLRVDRQLRSSGNEVAQHAEVRKFDPGQVNLSPRRKAYPQELAGQANAMPQALHPQATRGQPVAWSSGITLSLRAREVPGSIPGAPPVTMEARRVCGRSSRVWWAPLNPTSGVQGHSGGGWGNLAGNDLGTGSGWKQSKQNQTPRRRDETRSQSAIANLRAAAATPLHRSECRHPRRAQQTSTNNCIRLFQLFRLFRLLLLFRSLDCRDCDSQAVETASTIETVSTVQTPQHNNLSSPNRLSNAGATAMR
jgi:hypothetical protein